MSPQIRVDKDVYELLKHKAEPFVDTPNSVLRRELGLDAVSVKDMGLTSKDRSVDGASGTRRARAGELVPVDAYFEPILASLARHGGSATVATVLDDVGKQLSDDLTHLDVANLPSGGQRWRNRVQWARKHLVDKGLLEARSPHGTWTVSARGEQP
jgi:hypothetical protein